MSQKYTIEKGVVKFSPEGTATIRKKGNWNLLKNTFGITDHSQMAFEQQLGSLTLDELSHSDTRLTGSLELTGTANATLPYLIVMWLD